jgi:hypothetical protein
MRKLFGLVVIGAFLVAVPVSAAGQARQDAGNPFDLEAAHIFKIQNGKIHEIEAMGFSLPLNSKNGWIDFVR